MAIGGAAPPRNRAERRAAARRRGRQAVATLTGASMVATGMGVLFASPAHAATFTVVNGADSGAGSLRKAVDDANDGDTIKFLSSVTAVTISSGAIDVDHDLVIDGSDAPGLVVRTSGGNSGHSLLTVSGQTLTLAHLTVRDVITNTDGAVLSGSNAVVTLDDVTITGSGAKGHDGGALHLAGSTLAITDSTFTNNATPYYGGNLNGEGGAVWVSSSTSVTITDSTFDGNTSYYDGGAAYIEGTGSVTLSGSTFTHNHAGDAGGGVVVRELATSGSQSLVVEDTRFEHNVADGSTGGLDVRDDGGGAPTVEVVNSTFLANTGQHGGGMRVSAASLTLVDVEMTGNHAVNGSGGGLAFERSAAMTATVTITDSRISGNDAALDGGGLAVDGNGGSSIETSISGSTITGNGAQGLVGSPGGGGVFLQNVDATIVTSTVSGNHSRLGGGLHVKSSIVAVSSSTISGNDADEAGGGLLADSAGSVTLDQATMTDNDAGTTGGGLDVTTSSLTLRRSIVGGNRATGSGPDIRATAPTSTYSLVTAPGTTGITATGGNVVGQAPMLGALADNGGTTKTHLPLTGSPAIDAGDPAVTSGTDQRGLARRSGSKADIGAVEVQVAAAPAPAPVPVVAPPPPPSSGEVTTTPGAGGTSSASVLTSAGPVTVTMAPPSGDSPPTSVDVAVVRGSTLPANGMNVLATAFDVTPQGGAVASGKVCFPYSQSDVATSGLNESALQLFHFLADGTREVITSSLDTGGNQICGDTTSFSPFAIGVLATSRVAGVDAPSTAAALSAGTFPAGAPVVYLTTADGFADALGAGPAAGAGGGPTLLVHRGDVPAATRVELARLRPAKIVLVGGTAVIGDAVQAAVAPLAATVERVAGADRAETAAMLSAATFAPGIGVVYVVNGAGFADGLVAGAAAAANRGPVLLADRDQVPAATAAELARLKPTKVVVVGGTAAVSDAVVASLGASRLAGADRYQTAAVVAETFATGSAVLAATGVTPADALAAVAAAAKTRSAVVLVERASIPTRLLFALGILKPKAITVVGGTEAVTRTTEANLATGLGT